MRPPETEDTMIKYYKGDWSIPDVENRLSGKLAVDRDKRTIILKLYSKLHLNKEEIIFNQLETKGHEYYETILGETSQKLTLVNCALSGIESIGHSLFIISYRVEYVFINIHLLKISNLKIHKAEASFPYLSTFFDGWESLKDFEDKKEEIIYSDPIVISEDLSLKLIDRYLKNLSNMSGSYQLDYTKSIQFEYTNGVSFERLLKDSYTFSTLLSFTTNRTTKFKLNSLKIDVRGVQNYDLHYDVEQNIYPCYIINFTNSPEKIETELHQNHMMFSKWQFSNSDLNSLIKKWYENTKLRPIYDFYIDSNNWFKGKSAMLTNVMYNNRFLNLIQGLESYYDLTDSAYINSNEEFTQNRQKVLNKIDDEELKNWINKNLRYPKNADLVYKLEYLMKNFTDIFENVKNLNQFTQEYAIKAKDYRHKLSHGRIEKTYQGPEFDKLFAFSQILLCFSILHSIGMKNLDLKSICSTNYYFYNQMRKITSS